LHRAGNETGGRITPAAQEENLQDQHGGEFSPPSGDAASRLNYACRHGEKNDPRQEIHGPDQSSHQKPRGAKAAAATADAKRPTGQPKTRTKPKA